MITKSWADKIVMAWLVKQSNRTQSEPLNTQTSYTLRKEGCSCSKNLPAVITIKYAPVDIEVASVKNRKGLARAGSWFMTEG